MGTILLSAFCALALNVQSTEIKKDTIDKYVIDKQVIERFDGTQLEGKTISKYIIAYKDEGNVVEKTHIIYTDSTNSPVGNMIVNLDKPVNGQKLETLIVVDGKEISSSDFRKMNAEEIASMQVYKADSKMAKSYGEKGRDGVLWITTKANKASENIFFIDGRRAEKSEIDKLSPDKIANISVNKEKGISVIKVVTKK
jgi:hypothetical protein